MLSRSSSSGCNLAATTTTTTTTPTTRRPQRCVSHRQCCCCCCFRYATLLISLLGCCFTAATGFSNNSWRRLHTRQRISQQQQHPLLFLQPQSPLVQQKQEEEEEEETTQQQQQSWQWWNRFPNNAFFGRNKAATPEESNRDDDDDKERETSSVHLQLNELQQQQQQQQQPTTTATATLKNNNNNKTVTVLSFRDNQHQLWQSLNTSPRRFRAFLEYRGCAPLPPLDCCCCCCCDESTYFRSETVNAAEQTVSVRKLWRNTWHEQRLLTDRTELLAVFPSDRSTTTTTTTMPNNNKKTSPPTKRGGFADHLSLYVDRFLSVLIDTQQQRDELLSWLRQSYPETALLERERFSRLGETAQLACLKRFLEWFRSEFPYYYDRCLHCGVSAKEEASKKAQAKESNNEETDGRCISNNNNNDNTEEDENQDDEHSFIGFVFPNATELLGKASRTELYQCRACQQFTRFARYNAAQFVVDQRRGRCGEYSVLLYEILRALGHEARWVVDWADHVWAEIALERTRRGVPRRWVHLDPCEAAVDENLMYQGWGKKQTYILGFYAPATLAVVAANIEDLTRSYTSDDWKTIRNRRDEDDEHITDSLCQANTALNEKIETVLSQTC